MPFRCYQYVKTVSLNHVICLCYVRRPASVAFLVMKLCSFSMIMICIKESFMSVISIGNGDDTNGVVCLAIAF